MRRQREEDEIWNVSETGLAELWTVFRTDAVVQACRGVLLSRLLSGGIEYVDPKSGSKPDAEFADRVQRLFVPFARDIIDAICVQGFAAFVVDARTGTPNAVPPNVCSYSVVLDVNTFRRQLTMTAPNSDAPSRKAMFVVDNMPDRGGAVQSPMASYRRTHAFRGMVELNTATADYSAARPMIYTSMDSDKAFDRRHVYRNAIDTSVDARNMLAHLNLPDTCDTSVADVHRRAYETMVSMNDIQSGAHAKQIAAQQQAQLAEDLNGGRLDPRSVRLDPHTGLPVFDASMMQRPGDAYNVFTLPVDAKVQATVAPTSRRDLVAIFTHSAEMACIVMGVPAVCIGMRGATRVATEAEASSSALDTTLSRLNFILQRCLLDVYVALYGARPGLQVLLPAYSKKIGTEGSLLAGVDLKTE